jgi:hypothetical protein
MKKQFSILSATLLLFLGQSCELIKEVAKEAATPTKTRMEGTWEVTEAYNEKDSSIINKIAFPITAFNLASDHSVISTAGPMFMYIVYGDSKYTSISSSLDQVFNYATLNLNNGGEWFIDDGIVDKFTLEMKLEGLPGQKSLSTLLGLMGITLPETVVYHKFMDVSVYMIDNETMEWTFTPKTTAVYNIKDKYGDYVAWTGWSTSNFSKCTFILKKRTVSLVDLIKATPKR